MAIAQVNSATPPFGSLGPTEHAQHEVFPPEVSAARHGVQQKLAAVTRLVTPRLRSTHRADVAPSLNAA